MLQGRRARPRAPSESPEPAGSTPETTPADARVLRRLSLTVADAQGNQRTGEVLLADDWHPALDAAPDDAAFRIVLLTRQPRGAMPEVTSPAVALCLPAESRRGRGPIREAGTAYLTGEREQRSESFDLSDTWRYAQGSILTATTIAPRADEVFPPPAREPRLEVLATTLLEAVEAAAWAEEAGGPLLRALASALSAPQPLPQQPPDTARTLADLRSLLDTAEQALAARSPQEEGRGAADEAVDRLRRLAAARRLHDTLFAAQALYGHPMALAEDVYLARCLCRELDTALELAAMRRYLASAAVPEAMAELETDRRMGLETASFATLFHAPHRLDDMRATFEVFRKRYRAAYVAHHRRYWRSAAALRRALREAAVAARALERLNTLRELGRPVGEESLSCYRTLLSQTEACIVDEGLEGLLADRTACPSCRITLSDEPPEGEVQEALQGLSSALARQQARLSSEAVRKILAAGKGERLERFLQVVQASDLTGLANVLDDELLAFLRELLE